MWASPAARSCRNRSPNPAFRAFSVEPGPGGPGGPGGTTGTIAFLSLLSRDYAVMGRAEDASGHLLAFGCADVGAGLLPPGFSATLPLPLGERPGLAPRQLRARLPAPACARGGRAVDRAARSARRLPRIAGTKTPRSDRAAALGRAHLRDRDAPRHRRRNGLPAGPARRRRALARRSARDAAHASGSPGAALDAIASDLNQSPRAPGSPRSSPSPPPARRLHRRARAREPTASRPPPGT